MNLFLKWIQYRGVNCFANKVCNYSYMDDTEEEYNEFYTM